MSDTNINAYKAELIRAELDLDRAKTRVAALKEYIEVVEPSKSSKSNDSKSAESDATIKATDKVNDTRPVVESSVSELPKKSNTRGNNTSKKGK